MKCPIEDDTNSEKYVDDPVTEEEPNIHKDASLRSQESFSRTQRSTQNQPPLPIPVPPTFTDASPTATFENATLFSPSSIAKGKEAIPDHAIERETLPLHATTAGQEKQLDDILFSGAWPDASSMTTFDNASIFSNQSTSTWDSSVYDPLNVVEEFIALLLSDGLLHPLFNIAREAIRPQTFKVELLHLLRKYYSNLYKEAQDLLDKKVANFIRRYRREIAYAVCDDVYQDDAERRWRNLAKPRRSNDIFSNFQNLELLKIAIVWIMKLKTTKSYPAFCK